IDRQREIAAFPRRADIRDVLDDFAAAIYDDAAAPGRSAEPSLLRQLDALLPDVAVAGKSQDVAHHFTAGVIAAVFVVVVHALDAERRDARRDLGGSSALQVDEVLARVELHRQRAGRKVKRGGQRLQLL